MLRRTFSLAQMSRADRKFFTALLGTKIDALGARIDARIDAFGSFIPGYNANMVRDFVVSDEEDAMLSGASATFTYVHDGGKYYAIGAAHCALYYPPPFGRRVAGKNTLRFVCLPPCISKIAKRVLTAEHVSGVRSTDFVAVELACKPPLGKEPPQWPVPFSESSHGGHSVYGWSNSGHLGGHALVFDSASKTLSFIKERGEAGQSGTLMYSSHTHEPLGVYFGVRSSRTNLKPRGQIVSLPRPDTLRCHAVVRPTQSRFEYITQMGPFRIKRLEGSGKVDGVLALQDRRSLQSGVFIAHCRGVDFHGAKVCGASRPTPLPQGTQ